MEKPAQTDFAVHEIIARRWSPRAFADRPLPREVIGALLEAARWAPSSFNEQPWSFVVAAASEPETFARALECVVPGNREWARHAPLILLSLARSRFSRNERENRHAWHDVGLATASLSLQATAMGIGVHQMAGFDSQLARENFGIPDDVEPVAMMAVGYPGDPTSLSDELRELEHAPRDRRPLRDLAHRGRWGCSWVD